MATYPHMKAGEAEIWDRFRASLPWKAERIEYDVRLGEGAKLPEDVPAWVRAMAWSLSTKRVDAVVESADAIYLCEVKDRASLSAVGQLIGYATLYRMQFAPVKPLRMVCVCREVAPDMAPIFETQGIQVFVV